jgi:NADH dehydrogenase
LRPGQLHCVIVGAGATGVELAAELHKSMRDLADYNLDNIDFDKVIKIELVESAPRILNALPEHLSREVAAFLRRLDVTIRTGTRVIEVKADGVVLQGGEFVPAELIVWAAGIKAPDVLARLGGLSTDRLNRLIVRPSLQTDDDNVFAIGDSACCVLNEGGQPLPPRAQTAQQQANFMVGAFAARLDGRPQPAFVYRDRGSLVALSEYRTLGVLFQGFRIDGLLARLAYRSLYKQHLLAVFGFWKVALDTLAGFITRRTEPRIKLH